MTWDISDRIDLAGAGRIGPADVDRQVATAREIMARLQHQPGVVLADEVGMGKTYVALAVAVSVLDATRAKRPVVVMVPPTVRDKWPREWQVFRERCLRPDGRQLRAAPETVHRGIDFLRSIEQTGTDRYDVVFATHRALGSSLTDPWIRAAFVKRAFLNRPKLAPQRASFLRWSEQLLGPGVDAPVLIEYFDTPLHRWNEKAGGPLIPPSVLDAIPALDVRQLLAVLTDLPARTGPKLAGHLATARRGIKDESDALWRAALRRLKLRMPLVILDEAHHARHDNTILAGLFTGDEDDLDRGAFAGAFEKMLFLTATPFQLGHRELLRVLGRFDAVRWPSQTERRDFATRQTNLSGCLDDAHAAAERLKHSWGRLTEEDARGLPESWWRDQAPEGASPALRQVRLHIADLTTRLERAEQALQPWVIRHVRSDRDHRRTVLTGSAILDDTPATVGLEVAGRPVLPFLLAARAQGLLAAEGPTGAKNRVAVFAEGLASSFEAYRSTRQGKTQKVKDEDAGAPGTGLEGLPKEFDWYLSELDRALPPRRASEWSAHPKVAATVDRAVRLWAEREKVLIFCFYIETGRSLRDHLSRALRSRMLRDAARMLKKGLAPDADVAAALTRLSEQFFDPDARVTKAARATLETSYNSVLLDSMLSPDDRKLVVHDLVDVTLRFFRTPSFLVRYVDLSTRNRATAVANALSREDSSRQSLATRLQAFARHVAELVPEERQELLIALRALDTGTSLDTRVTDHKAADKSGAARPLANVRLVNGATDPATRRRTMLAFNTPFLPDVLIASAVLGEGVDLHLDCRYVIHHDRDWNPAIIEQRTGRVDRLGCKAESSGEPIVIYEPYIAGAHDEKQHRVVHDRAAWFDVVMGQQFAVDEWSTDREAERVPLPSALARELTLDLSVWKSDEDAPERSADGVLGV